MSHQQIHGRISEPLYKELKSLASSEKMSVNAILEAALREYLRVKRRQALAHQLEIYIDKTAQYSDEFVKEFEDEVTRRLLEDTEW